MPKRTKSKLEVKPVEKKTKNNIVNNNENSCFATSHKIVDCEFVRSCISNTLKDDDKKALEKVKNFNFKGNLLILNIGLKPSYHML